MKYLIQKTEPDGGFVAPSGSEHHYTRDPLKARRYRSLEMAQRCCWETEFPVALDDAVKL